MDLMYYSLMKPRFNSYQHRPQAFENTTLEQWQNWIWQQQHAVRNSLQLSKIFPKFPTQQLKMAQAWEQKGFRFLLTPYALSLVELDNKGNPRVNDVIWRQIFPVFEEFSAAPDEYSKEKENWEISAEMISPIAQHKYENRVIIYTADACLGYCVYCFRSLQSNATQEKHGGKPHWQQTMEAIAKLPKVEEVILSGGDPLIFANNVFETMIKDLRALPNVKAIRIHTRAWTHNPFRMDKPFCELLKKYKVTEIGVHVVHPRELTQDFHDAVSRIRASGARTLLMTDTPLIKGVNDDAEILHELFMGLYLEGVKPYYLSHNMPNIPAAGSQRTSVRQGLRLYNSLKRRISNVAMPEYALDHKYGKKTVPECEDGTPDFIYTVDETGWPIIRFKNWKGEWHEYLDAQDNY